MAQIGEDEIAKRLAELDGWARSGNALRKTFVLATFPAAIAFVTQVGFLAEAAGHHPDIDIRYQRVTLTLTTHDAGGLTANDFAVAAQVDGLVG